MKIEYDRILANKKFDYEISRDEFNKLMRIKKTAERYDRFGRKKVTIERDSKGKAFVKAGVKPPERIKSDYIKGPIAIVCFSTKPELADATDTDHYLKQCTITVEEGESVRVYRDSLNDGFCDAKFCDDTTMLIMLSEKDKTKRYFKIEGEPTCYSSWKFDQEQEETKKFFKDTMDKQWDIACKETGLQRENVYIVIQLENV